MIRVITGDCREVLRTLPDESVHCAVTSPPEFKRVRAEQKRLKRENELEKDEREVLENIRDALGDFAETPLGAAALH